MLCRIAAPCLLMFTLSTPVATLAQTGFGDFSDRVDLVFAEWDNDDSPGCAVGVIGDGEFLYKRGYGMADLETGTPIATDGVFYMASVSKQFVAASLALLALDGAISMDDDVRRYIPELPDYGHTITLRHLVTHTSGIRDYLELMGMAGMPFGDVYVPQQILQLIVNQEALNFVPGERYSYSNSAYFLIPLIIERVTGKTFRDFANERIFTPLEMTSTGFHDDHTRPVPNRVFSYGTNDEDEIVRTFLDNFDQVGSGGLLSTVDDMIKWDRNFYDPVVGGNALIEMTTTRGIFNSGDTSNYAFGLQIQEYKGERTVSHTGSMMGFKTAILRFPEQRFTVVALCNLGEIVPMNLSYDIANIYLGDTFSENLSEFEGVYRSKELGIQWTVELDGQELTWTPSYENGETGTLEFREPRVFRARGVTVTFQTDGNSTITGFILDGGRAQGIKFEKISVP